MADWLCTSCHTMGAAKSVGPGVVTNLLGITFALAGWVFVWPVGLLFTIALLTGNAGRKRVCRACGQAVIPGDSPRARELTGRGPQG